VRAGVMLALALLALARGARLSQAVAAPAVERVVTMLTNLQAEVEAEQQGDDTTYQELEGWCSTQTASSEARLAHLRSELESLGAALATLGARRGDLATRVAELDSQVETQKTQIADAQDKRQKEEAAFVAEQQDFENSVAACTKAVEILKEHYGDGAPPQNTRPAWMSLLQVQQTVTHMKAWPQVPIALQSLLQQAAKQPGGGFFGKKPGFHGTYESKTDEGLGIVAQMGVLRQTFMDDKQAAIDEENRLQQAFQALMTEKTAQLQALVEERDGQQAELAAVSQEIGEKEQQQANLQQEAKDEEAYLGGVKQQCVDGEAMYVRRKEDRGKERAGIAEAVRVLQESAAAISAVAPPAFVQLKLSVAVTDAATCRACPRVAAMLTEAARRSGSELLVTAAALTGSAALQEVLQALQEMLRRLDEEQQSETQHKAWCDQELGATQAKKQEHEAVVEQLQQAAEDLREVIGEKEQALKDNKAALDKADAQYTDQAKVRDEERKAFQIEQQHYADAIAALKQAGEILTKAFEAQAQQAFLQQAPAPQFAAYSSKAAGGNRAVELLAQLGAEFQQASAEAASMEQRAQEDFETATKLYNEARRDLLDARDGLTAMLQSAQEKLDQTTQDIDAHQQEVKAAADYLSKLGQSCNALLSHYDARVKRRGEERAAITEAVNVLKGAPI